MSISGGFIVPHPPLIVPAVGRGQEQEIQKTVDSYRAVAEEIAALKPETVVIISPHSVMYADYFHLSGGDCASGSLARFGAPEQYSVNYDAALVGALSSLCETRGFPAGTLGERDKSLDHGTLIPLHFIRERLSDFKLVRCSVSGLSLEEHYEFGILLNEAIEALGLRAVIVASGDFSHKLSETGPYGFSIDGPELDARLVEIIKSGDFGELFDLDSSMCENAAECGLRSFVVMAGALDKKSVAPKLHSYEGPFGVGYAVASFGVKGDDMSRDFLAHALKKSAEHIKKLRENEDAYTSLARKSLETYVKTGNILAIPDNLPEEMLSSQAGVFVSIKKRGGLRGCIGTISPTRENIAAEIIHNAISAGACDSRFAPVLANELDELVYSVDVLSPPEPVGDKSGLDVNRYGVIVSDGSRRGLLLPNLDGVDTVDDQLEIACQKAGIPSFGSYDIERFEVVRHK